MGSNRRQTPPKGRPFQDLVADVAKAFEPHALVEKGQWVVGPDGLRELDVTIRGLLNGQACFVLIECKDYTYSTKRRSVGIPDVDAFESKRRDMGADFALMASNTGFSPKAMTKAARTRIGTIAIVKSGDARAKARILHAVYLRRFTEEHGRPRVTYFAADGQAIPNLEAGFMTFGGELIEEWLLHQAVNSRCLHPFADGGITAKFQFIRPITATYRDREIVLSAIAIAFCWKTEWRRQIVELDAGVAMYDYLNTKLVLAQGANFVSLKDVHFATAQQCEPPNEDDFYRAQRGVQQDMCLFEGKITADMSVEDESMITAAIVPADLEAVYASYLERMAAGL